ncbi:hypothetical protein K8R03_01120 [Candidatus Kaiserbacteria bacterium]|nr:hypothetical protein [Candidatus Kaiserbacteria bacterium]
MTRIIYISWALLAASVCFFGAVIYEAGVIQTSAAERASAVAAAEQQGDRTSYSQRIRAIVADTQNERDTLESFAHLDIVSTVQMLESTGKSAGVNAKVTNALPGAGGQDLPGGGKLQSVSFSLVADGSFQNLMHAVELYENLPLASKIGQFDIERGSGTADAKTPWHMTLVIRVTSIATGL